MLQSDISAGISSQCRLGLGRMKHVQIRLMFLQQIMKDNLLKIRKIRGIENTADIGRHRDACGMAGPEANVCEVTGEKKNENEMTLRSTQGLRQCLAGLVLLLMLERGESRGAMVLRDDAVE